MEKGILDELYDATKFTDEEREALVAEIMGGYVPDDKAKHVEAIKKSVDLDAIEALL